MTSKGNLPPRGDQILNPGALFDNEALLYDRLRPGYPDELFNKLVELTGLSESARLLEIGCGTGQATIPMARRGYSVTAVDTGSNFAQLTQARLQQFPGSVVINDSFENAELPEESFDLVYSATAFHWIKEAVKFTKTHRLLKPGGYLAIIKNEPVSGGDSDRFFPVTGPIFERYGITAARTFARKPEDLKPEVVDSSLFELTDFFITSPFVRSYNSASEYIDYLRTVSFLLVMPETKREALLSEIREMVTKEFGDKVDNSYSAALTLARKK